MNPALQTEITTHIEIPQFWTNSSVGIMLEAQRKQILFQYKHARSDRKTCSNNA